MLRWLIASSQEPAMGLVVPVGSQCGRGCRWCWKHSFISLTVRRGSAIRPILAGTGPAATVALGMALWEQGAEQY